MDTSACLDSFHTFISKTFYFFNQVSNYESIDIISIIVWLFIDSLNILLILDVFSRIQEVNGLNS